MQFAVCSRGGEFTNGSSVQRDLPSPKLLEDSLFSGAYESLISLAKGEAHWWSSWSWLGLEERLEVSGVISLGDGLESVGLALEGPGSNGGCPGSADSSRAPLGGEKGLLLSNALTLISESLLDLAVDGVVFVL